MFPSGTFQPADGNFPTDQGWKNVDFLTKLLGFRFSTQGRPKLRPERTSHSDCPTLPVTSFSVSYNKTHKSRLKYEIKYDPYKIAQKAKT